MRNLNFLKLFYGLMLVMVSTAFVSCVDDNDDTEAPYLEVSPTTLIFGLDGQEAKLLLTFQPTVVGKLQ